MNDNENTITPNLWYPVKSVLRERFIAIQAYLKKQEKSQINNLTLHLKQLEKEEMKNPRVSRRKEIFRYFSHLSDFTVLVLGCCVFIFICFYAYFDFF